MNPVVARSSKHLLPAVTVMAFLGCDQVKDITSGGGTKDADPAPASYVPDSFCLVFCMSSDNPSTVGLSKMSEKSIFTEYASFSRMMV